MNNTQTINIDYISTIEQIGNLVKSKRVEIKKPVSLLSTLKIMLDNPNNTIYDLQNQMTMHFSNNDRKPISFLSPYSYYSSYVEGVSFPKIYTYDEFRALKEDIKASVLQSYESTLKFYQKEYGEAKYQEALSEYIQRETDNRKQAYYRNCIRYIDAYYYRKNLLECKNQPNIKMYSEEAIGWRGYKYTVNADIDILVNTNFGFGNSSYFYISLRYKGIDILPYSFVVNYFYADIREIRKCTRNYKAEAENWNFAFDFVEEAINLAATDQLKFCEDFVQNEIKAMLSGLEDIVRSPKNYVDKFTTMKNKENPIPYLCIRHIGPKETNEYNSYPSDIPIAIMSEKISDAHQLLDNLSTLSEIFPFAKEAIEKIHEITARAIPIAETQKAINLSRLEVLNNQLDVVKSEIEIYTEKRSVHDIQIKDIFEAQKEKEGAKSHYEISKEYENAHPGYRDIKNYLSNKEVEKFNLSDEIMARNSFVRRLDECLKLK